MSKKDIRWIQPYSNYAKAFGQLSRFIEKKELGVTVLLKSGIHQKFALFDSKIIWFGSINLLSFGYSEESIMRLVSSNIALELSNTIDQKGER